MHENESHNSEMMPEAQLKKDFKRLQNIAKVLGEMGFQVIEYSLLPGILENPTAEAGFPIVSDGLDGIRASYTKDRGLEIWFTNGFEDPDNPRRKEVVERLRQARLL